MFVVYEGTEVKHTFPAGRVEFDSTNVPTKVITTFEEALTCAADECYVAAAMLIRKTLEVVCEDHGASGSDLKSRIGALRSRVTLPSELFDAMDHLRLLGNDAAHVDAKSYDSVGKPEIDAGVELTKEVIKATYQYKGLLGKLQALRKP
jgi:hypothetical protein